MKCVIQKYKQPRQIETLDLHVITPFNCYCKSSEGMTRKHVIIIMTIIRTNIIMMMMPINLLHRKCVGTHVGKFYFTGMLYLHTYSRFS